MKRLLFILLTFISLQAWSQSASPGRSFTGEVPLINYVGASAAEAAPGMRSAFTDALNSSRDIRIPAGTWAMNSLVSAAILTAPANTGAVKNIRFIGDYGATITGSFKIGAWFFVSNANYKIEFYNINFVSTHDTTNVGNNCFLFQNTNRSSLTVNVYNCTFTGFTTPIVLKGITSAHIEGNSFFSPLGHDNATTTTNPATYILLKDDSLGDRNQNVWIGGNYFEGCPSTLDITTTKTKMPMDNAVYGHADGLFINKNYTYRFCQEHYNIQPLLGYTDSAGTSISDNILNCNIPTGTTDLSSQLITSNYGIRCDAKKSSISNNHVYDATWGIMQYLPSWAYVNKSISITNNQIYITHNSALHPQYGILVQGNATNNRSKSANISGNTIHIDSVKLYNTFNAIFLGSSDSGKISGNFVYQSKVTETGGGVKAITFNNSTGSVLGINTMIGVDTTVASASSTYKNYLTVANNAIGGPPRLVSDTLVEDTTFYVNAGYKVNLVGNYLKDSFQRASLGSAYTSSLSSATLTFPSSAHLHVTGGSNDFTNFSQYTNSGQFFSPDKYKVKFGVVAQSNASTDGIGFGFTSVISNNPASYYVKIDLGSANNAGIQVFNAKNLASTPLVTVAGLVFNTGDSLLLEVTRFGPTFQYKLTNIKNGLSITANYTYDRTLATNYEPNLSTPELEWFHGTQDVWLFQIIDLTQQNGNVIGLGDSIMEGYKAGGLYSYWIYLLFRGDYNLFDVSAGVSEQTSDAKGRVGRIILAHPHYCLINLGVNDKYASVTDSVFKTNLDSISAPMIRAGITVILITLVPQTTVDITSYNTDIHNLGIQRGIKVVDITTALEVGTAMNPLYNSGDGVHPNTAGHALADQLIYNACPELFTGYIENNSAVYRLPQVNSTPYVAGLDSAGRLYKILNQGTVPGLDAVLGVGNTSSNTITLTGHSTSVPRAIFGNTSIQSYDATDNFIQGNIFYNSGAGHYQYLENGAGAGFYFYNNGIIFQSFASGTAGANASTNLTNPMGFGTDGTVFIGGSSGALTAPYTGATMTVTGSSVMVGDPSATPVLQHNVFKSATTDAGAGYAAVNESSTGNGQFYASADRGTNSYGTLIHGGSTNTSGSNFGLTHADKTFLLDGGTNSLGLALGTLQNTPITFGTNNATVAVLSGAGALRLNNYGVGTFTGTAVHSLLEDASGNIIEGSLSGGVTTVGSFSGSSQTNGASISTNTITFGPADATNPGMVTTGSQTLAGAKTFSAKPIFPAPTTSSASIHLTGASASPTSPTTGDVWYDFSLPGLFIQPLGAAAPINLTAVGVDISSTSLALSNTSNNIMFNGGSAASWTLPAGLTYQTVKYTIKNRGTAAITLSRSGSDVIYLSTSPVNSITINPGDIATVFSTGGGNWAASISPLIGSLIQYQHTIFTPTTGGTVSLVNNQYNIINPAGALVALTVNLPSSPANNDVVYIKFTQTISTVTYGNGTVVDGITAPTAGGLTILTFDSGTSSWY